MRSGTACVCVIMGRIGIGLLCLCLYCFTPTSRGQSVGEQKESLGAVIVSVAGFIAGIGFSVIIITAVVWWRRKSYRTAGNPSTAEMSSSAHAKNLNDSAIKGPGPSLPASSTAGVAASAYEIEENDDDRNNGGLWQNAPPPASSTAGDANNFYEIEENDNDRTSRRLWQAASSSSSTTAGTAASVYETVENNNDRTNGGVLQTAPPHSTSAAGVGGNVYGNETKENNYDKLCHYCNDDSNREPYTDLADVTAQN